MDKLDTREILITSPIPTVSALTIDLDKKIVLSNINLNDIRNKASSLTPFFVEETKSLQETSGFPSSEPKHCPDNDSSFSITVDSCTPSSEPRCCQNNSPSTSIDIGPSADPSISPKFLQLQCTYLVFYQSQHDNASCISSVSDPNASSTFVSCWRDPCLSRVSSLLPFVSNSE